MTTINYCGDSFVASDSSHSWTSLLAKKLEAQILGLGKKGSATEHAINTFNPLANITIFAWTESSRLYHPAVSINTASVEELSTPIHKAARLYYKFLHSFETADEKQRRLLYWFDHEVLSQYKGIAIHLWGFKQTYVFKHGINYLPVLVTKRDDAKAVANHFSLEQNEKFCETLYSLYKQQKVINAIM